MVVYVGILDCPTRFVFKSGVKINFKESGNQAHPKYLHMRDGI